MRSVLFATVALSILNFTIATPDSLPRVFHKRDLCTENDQVDCFDNCMPPDGVCCNDGSGTYCPSGEYCVPNGCCPIGEECSGGGGTITNDILTGTGALPTATSVAVTQTGGQTGGQSGAHTGTHAPATVQTSPTQVVGATNTQAGTAVTPGFTNPMNTLNAQTPTTVAVVTNVQATTSAAGSFKGSGNAVSALSDGIERYVLILIAGGQLLFGW